MSLRTTMLVLLGVLAGTAVGWWTATSRRSAAEGIVAGATACAATIRFFHEVIESDRG